MIVIIAFVLLLLRLAATGVLVGVLKKQRALMARPIDHNLTDAKATSWSY